MSTPIGLVGLAIEKIHKSTNLIFNSEHFINLTHELPGLIRQDLRLKTTWFRSVYVGRYDEKLLDCF